MRLKPSMICYSYVTHPTTDLFKYLDPKDFLIYRSCYISVTMGITRTGVEARGQRKRPISYARSGAENTLFEVR